MLNRPLKNMKISRRGKVSANKPPSKKEAIPKKRGKRVPGRLPNYSILFRPFQYYFYGGDVPSVLAITDNLRAQVHMLSKAALEEAVIHHFSHIYSRADGSSASL